MATKKARVKKVRRPKLEVYESVNGDYWWTLHTTNGKIVADSGEGYQRKPAAEAAARRILDAARNAVLIVDGVEVADQPNYDPTQVKAADVQHHHEVAGDTVEAIQPDNASLVVPDQAPYVMRGT